MSLHADVAVPAPDRQRLERLCRYVARPPLARCRLEAMADGRLAYRLKTPWRDGTTHVVMERRELLERLAPLIPPPRAHQVRYHGVLAPCASGRDKVVPAGPEVTQAELTSSGPWGSDRVETGLLNGAAHDEAPAAEVVAALRAERNDSLSRRIAWADLLKRVFEVDALRCPACGGRMRLVAPITEARVAARILECLSLPPRAPPLATEKEVDSGFGVSHRAREPQFNQALDESGFEFDQT